MNDYLLTFEFSKDLECLEIHVNANGIAALIKALSVALEVKDHQHLMTPEWGGEELSSEKQCDSNDLIHHVKIIPWE